MVRSIAFDQQWADTIVQINYNIVVMLIKINKKIKSKWYNNNNIYLN